MATHVASATTRLMTRGAKAAPSRRPGMGALPYETGTTFRLWAPNAEAVFVAGTFNDWSPMGNPLAQEENGYWSVDVEGAKAGDHYKYRILNGDQDLWRIDAYAREVTNSVGDAVIYDPTFDWDADNYRTPPWNEMVIYEMHIGTFNGDDAHMPGTFDQAIEKLPYLRDMGINTIELMPIQEFPGGISWGYSTAHPFAIESDYGGPNGFKRFVKAAHEHGMAVILDVVYNHFGPNDLSLWQFDGWSENGRGGIYFYQDERANTPWGDTRPDYGRSEVRQYIRDNALMWLEDYHLDGLRVDAVAYIRNYVGDDSPDHDLPDGWSLMQWLNEEIDMRQPWKVTIAEDLRHIEAITTPAALGGMGFDAQWDAGFHYPVNQNMIRQEDADRSAEEVAGAVTNRYNDDAFKRVIYTESHDEVGNGLARIPEQIWPGNAGSWYSKKRSTLGACLLFTSPGIPMILQGQEFLTDSWFKDDKPLDWSKLEQYPGIQRLYTDLIQLRRNYHNTTRGLSGQFVDMYHVNPEAKVIAYHRYDKGGPQDSVVVVVNLTSQPWEDYWVGLPAEGLWKVRLFSDASVYDPEFTNQPCFDVTGIAEPQDGQPAKGKVSLGPYTAVILSQDAG